MVTIEGTITFDTCLNRNIFITPWITLSSTTSLTVVVVLTMSATSVPHACDDSPEYSYGTVREFENGCDQWYKV